MGLWPKGKGNAAGSNNDDWNPGFGQKYGPLEILHSLCVDGHCVDGGDAEECWAADVVGAREGGEKGAASAADYWTSGRAKGCEVRLLAFQGACFLEMECIGKMELFVCCLFFRWWQCLVFTGRVERVHGMFC